MTPERPLCLIVPGLDNSGPDHWQSLWESRRDDCRRVDLGCWSEPDRRVCPSLRTRTGRTSAFPLDPRREPQ